MAAERIQSCYVPLPFFFPFPFLSSPFFRMFYFPGFVLPKKNLRADCRSQMFLSPLADYSITLRESAKGKM
jgi:hypothetical protein